MSRRRRAREPRAPHSPATRASSLSPGAWSGRLAWAALICGLVVLGYLPAVRGGFIWDDRVLLSENALVRAPDGLFRFWFTTEAHDYWPLTSTTFWLEWRLWGADPTGYHVTNVALHALEALLLWVILDRLRIPGAGLAALLFAVHPVNVESVAWIAQRKNLVALLFLELTVLAWLASDGDELPRRPRARLWYALSLACFVLAMLGKGSAAILPLVLLLLAWWRRGRLAVRDFVRVAPFVPLAVGLVLVNVWFQTHGTGPIREAGPLERVAGAGAVVWFYLFKALLPLDLAFVYPHWQVDPGRLAWWLPLMAALAVSAWLWLRRASWSRPILMAWTFFGIALGPVMGFTDVYFMKYALVADHYQHVAIVGVLALVGAGWSRWAQGRRRLPAMALAVAVVGLLALLTRRQSATYTDEEALFRATLRTNPACWLCHHNLGVSLGERGLRQEARAHYEQAVRLKPDLTDARVNLGVLLIGEGRPADALAHLREAVRLDPRAAQARYNLGLALAATGRPQEAVDEYEAALRLEPDDADTHNALGSAWKLLGRDEQARAEFERALRLRPGFPEALVNLGLSLARAGSLGEAVARLTEAARLKPDDAEVHYDLAFLLTDAGRRPDAIAHYQAALRLRPDYAEAHNNLAIAFSDDGRLDQAVAHFQAAARLRPDFFDARLNLVETLARSGRRDAALAEARAALDSARALGQRAWETRLESWLARHGAR